MRLIMSFTAPLIPVVLKYVLKHCAWCHIPMYDNSLYSRAHNRLQKHRLVPDFVPQGEELGYQFIRKQYFKNRLLRHNSKFIGLPKSSVLFINGKAKEKNNRIR